jgi:hypothetical protein
VDAGLREGGMDADSGMDGGRPAVSDGGNEAGPDAAEDARIGDAAEDAGEDASTHGCVPGTYGGTFEGRVAFFGIPLFDISGNIVAETQLRGTGNKLRISSGRIRGADPDGNPIDAEIGGEMDCFNYRLRDGVILNGTYVRNAFNMTIRFEGSMEATYNPGPTPSVAGTWRTQGGNESGRGTFAATLTETTP